ncbi:MULTISPECIES: hypothetical protein [Bradyrhizobium]|uniref:hypothetical protein n=1 Tax=Bradyrhizobium TaxID=374 RepID=UPI00159F2163|nr:MULTISPECIES: hypothetical protein [Bradyrhizobium]MCP1838347.1 hypothetical protein [Bradyrhizobium sp. USDA 4538]MCP1898911.1 hypothetical protein [Bradyrhizobium sp. USDA 4537]MCP1909408.1 hypothetical protein [Bradyrhizobium elkanii]MCP1986976.1 hypothetical protein [Bradyrhizobium sp. USDA 4539]
MPDFKVIARLHFDEQTMFVGANNTPSGIRCGRQDSLGSLGELAPHKTSIAVP